MKSSGVTLTVDKTVAGAMGDLTKEFAFTAGGLTAGTEYTYAKYETEDGAVYTPMTGADAAGTLTADGQGKISFRLKHHQRIEILLPAGTTVSVTEQTSYYTAEFTAVETDSAIEPKTPVTETILPEGATGKAVNGVKLKVEKNTTLSVTNTLEQISPTGVTLRFLPYVFMLLAAGLIFMLMRRRKQNSVS